MKERFLIIECSRCKAFLISKQGQKIKTCPFCNFKLKIFNVKILGIADSLKEAKEQLSLLRMEKRLKESS